MGFGDELLGIEVVHTLILAGVAAIGEALADGLEALKNALTELARENGRLGRCIVCKFAGFSTDLHHLTLFHDDHALTVGHGDAGAV